MKRTVRAIARFFSSSSIWLGLGSLLWLVVRSGTRPSRLRYPCQQAAAATGTFWLSAFLAPGILRGLRHAGVKTPSVRLDRRVVVALATATTTIGLLVAFGGLREPQPVVPAPV